MGPVWGCLGAHFEAENGVFSKSAGRYFLVKDVGKKSAETFEMEGGNFEEVTKKRRKKVRRNIEKGNEAVRQPQPSIKPVEASCPRIVCAGPL